MDTGESAENWRGTPLPTFLATEIVRREGGYVHQPHYRGGPTKYGTTQAVAPLHSCQGDVRDLPENLAAFPRRGKNWAGSWRRGTPLINWLGWVSPSRSRARRDPSRGPLSVALALLLTLLPSAPDVQK